MKPYLRNYQKHTLMFKIHLYFKLINKGEGSFWHSKPLCDRIVHVCMERSAIEDYYYRFPERESPLLQRWDESEVEPGVSLAR